MTTANKNLETPLNGSDINTWDQPINSNSQIIDSALGGTTTINITAVTGTVILTATQYQKLILKFTGTLTGNVNYQVPSGVGGMWAVVNSTAGAFNLVMSSGGGGSTATIPQGFTAFIISDGTNVGFSSTAPSSAGGSNTQVQYNKLGSVAGSTNLTFNDSTNTLTLTGSIVQTGNQSITGNVSLLSQGKLSLQGAASNSITFQAAAATAAVNYVWPINAGAVGQFLTSDGAGNLSWTGAVGGVTTFSAGTTGLTPSANTGGAVTLGGTLGVANGGTGVTTATGTGSVVLSASPTFTGTPAAPTAAGGTNTTQIATTGFVTGALGTYAPLASPALTGNPTAPTQAANDSSTKLATTAFVNNLFSGSIGANGYITLPGGLIIQWGTGSGTFAGQSSSATFNFPTSFSSAVYSVTATLINSGSVASTVAALQVVSTSTSGATVHSSGYQSGSYTSLTSFYWIAIGK